VISADASAVARVATSASARAAMWVDLLVCLTAAQKAEKLVVYLAVQMAFRMAEKTAVLRVDSTD
jgi:hypothetical protein